MSETNQLVNYRCKNCDKITEFIIQPRLMNFKESQLYCSKCKCKTTQIKCKEL
jgi:hypothetical protein